MAKGTRKSLMGTHLSSTDSELISTPSWIAYEIPLPAGAMASRILGRRTGLTRRMASLGDTQATWSASPVGDDCYGGGRGIG